MATLTVKLTLTSTDTGTSALDATTTSAITVSQPTIDIARASILHTAPTELLSAAAHVAISGEVYFYVKNMDGTNFVEIKTAGAVNFARLRAGEFMFLPLREAIGLEVQAHTAACIVEYGYWSA